MTIAPNPVYRNTRKNFYTDKASDTTEIGTIISTMKAVTDVHDNSFIPTTPSYNFTTGQITRETAGNAQTGINPEYQYPGYIYCDGSEYKIEDYPALYTIIGSEYGGTPRPGLKLVSGGTGYPTTGSVTITFTAPTGNETDKETIEADLTIDATGVITAVSTTKLGKRYSSDPTFTLQNAGTGSGLSLEFNFNGEGTLEDVKQDNVFSKLGETKSLGTFMVPDLKTKKIVGTGPVYGPGSPTIGLITEGVGADKVGGKWLFDKSSQNGYFSLGSVTTTKYEKITDTTGVTISGTQTVKVSMRNKRLSGVPQHNHYVYHTKAGEAIQSLSGFSGDRYVVEYTNQNSRLFQWFPVGGVAFEHKHALLKKPLQNATDVATYDILDWTPGAEGTGSLKTNTPSQPAITKAGSPSSVNTSQNTLILTSHGFSTGDEVLYSVGNLVVDIAISEISTANDTFTVTSHAWSTTDSTQYGKGSLTFPVTSSASTVNTTNDRITITAHGMSNGTAIKYVSTGGTAIGGIIVGYTYYARVVDANTVTLHITPGDATSGTSVIDLTDSGTGVQTFSVQGAVVPPLIDANTYYIISVDANTIKLATTSANATAGTAIDITGTGQGVHTLTSPGTAIAPLTNGTKYYVIKVDNDTIKLASSLGNAQGGTSIDFTSTGVGNFTLFKAAVQGDGYYMASGGAGAGSYEVVNSIPVPVFRKFSSSSVIGGRTITTGGVPVVEYPGGLVLKNTPQTGTGITFPNDWTTLLVTCCGGGGSGSPGNAAGNDGSQSKVEFGGSLLTVTAGGGQGGGKNTARTDGGPGGTVNISGSKAGDVTIISQATGTAGTNGTAGTYYKKTYPTTPGQAGTGGDNVGSLYTNDGTDGLHTFITDNNNPGSSGNQTGSGSISLASTQFEYTQILVTLAGASGSDPTNKCGCGSVGGNGDVMVLQVNNPVNGFDATYETGTRSGGKPGGSGAYGANGGVGGNKWGSGTDGAGGGGASGMKVSASIIAGAGGGGGGGGTDGQSCSCGLSGTTNNTSGWNSDTAQETTANLFPGGGSGGQNAGCNGGGGGGGGGGIATSNYGSGTGSGGGVGAGAGHGGGYGGGRGMSSFKTSIFTKVSQGNNSTGNGYISWSWNEDRSYWTNGGGGGGAGGRVYWSIAADKIGSNVSATLDVGGGGSGVGGTSSGGAGFVQYGFGVITGYEGGTTSTTVGDIIIKASGTTDDNGPSIVQDGTGGGNSGGFQLPTIQVPEVEVVSGTSGGSGAAASVTLGNGVVSTITKTANGSGYTSAPEIRIKHGAGSGSYATSTVNNAQEVDSITLSNLVARSTYTNYCKIGGAPTGTGATDYHRWITIKEHDCTNVKRFNIKACRGNGFNGGDLPEQGGDVLKLYYNTDMSDNFTALMGIIVPLPTAAEVTSKYDGDGTGNDATKWYWYSMDLPEAAQTATTRFQIKQERPAGSGSNDSGSNSDHYGICDIIYEYKEVSSLTFIPSDGKISTNADELTYVVEGNEASIYTSGATALDATFTLNSQNPLIPVPAIDPDYPVPVVEPYHLCKYLIKAF